MSASLALGLDVPHLGGLLRRVDVEAERFERRH